MSREFTPYSFAENEFFSIHPITIDNLADELETCLCALNFIIEHTEDERAATLLDMLEDRLKKLEPAMRPEALRQAEAARVAFRQGCV